MERGLKEKIDELDLDDLRLVSQWTSAATEKRRNEKKIPLWVVADDWVNHAAVPIDQHEKAVQIAAKVLVKMSRVPGDIEIKIFKHHFLEHEAKEMMQLWEEPRSKGAGKV